MIKKVFTLIVTCFCVFSHVAIKPMRPMKKTVKRPVRRGRLRRERLYTLLAKELNAGHYKLAEKLIEENKLDVNKKISDKMSDKMSNKMKPLAYVFRNCVGKMLRRSAKDMIRYLIKKGASLTDLNFLGRSVLHIALHDKNLFDFLMEFQEVTADVVNAPDKDLVMPLYQFIVTNRKRSGVCDFYYDITDYLSFIKKLLSKGAIVKDDEVQELVYDDPATSFCRVFPLHMAVLHGPLDLVKTLIERGASVNKEALYTPVYGGKSYQEAYLYPEDIYCKYTPLDLVAHRLLSLGDHEKIAKLLLKSGAQVTQDTRRRLGLSVLDHGLKERLKEIFLTATPSRFEEEMRAKRVPLVFEAVHSPQKDCVICTYPFDNDDRESFYLYPCGHNICSKCLRHIASEGDPKCPFCRREIEAVELVTKARVKGSMPPVPSKVGRPPAVPKKKGRPSAAAFKRGQHKKRAAQPQRRQATGRRRTGRRVFERQGQ